MALLENNQDMIMSVEHSVSVGMGSRHHKDPINYRIGNEISKKNASSKKELVRSIHLI